MKIENLLKSILPIILILLFFGCGDPPSEENTASNQAEVSSIVIPVEALNIKAQTMTHNVKLTGVISPIDAVDIIAEVSGKVEKVVKKLGNKITTNDTLAFIDDRIPLANYLQAKSQVLSAENNLNIFQLNLKSDEELYSNGDISKLALQNSQLAVKSAEANLLSAKANLSLREKGYYDTRITSPINGLISRKNISIGTMVNQGMPIYTVVDLSKLKIEVGVAQDLIDKVRIGSKAALMISGLNNAKYNAYVAHISPQADEATGVFKIEIHLNNTRDMKILAGMTANIDLELTSLEEALFVPDHSIVTRGEEEYVYKIENGIAKLTPIVTNGSFGANVLIVSGIDEGDQIVVVGMKNLGIDTKVEVEVVH
ncbi:efflux RND transporter periplasmic adaptor subunit [Bacteroidota bacterium]